MTRAAHACRTLAFGLLLACSWQQQARAQGSPYDLTPAADASAIGVSAVLWWGPALLRSSFVDGGACPCNARNLNGLDRGFAGLYRPGLSLASDVASGSTIALALLLSALDVHGANEPLSSWLTDVVVMAEAVFMNGAVNELAKIGSARPRPLVYGRAPGDARLADPESYVSFYSAHTSGAFAVGLAYAQTFAYRHPESPWRFALYAGAVALGSGIGVARVASGKHFPSDVLAGAAAGTAFGLIVPWLHRRRDRALLGLQLGPGQVEIRLALRAP